MTMNNEQSKVNLTEAEFVQLYGENRVALDDGTLADFTINYALEVEAIMCQGKPERRSDPKKRLNKLAKYAGEALLPEHRGLLTQTEE